MERLIFVPIEPLQERYSEQWVKWFADSFNKNGIKFETVGDLVNQKIEHGQFLDVFNTNIFKLNQMVQIIEKIKASPKDSFTVFFMDAWFPSIEALAYVRDTMKINIKIKGMIHAGTYDPHDFLTQSGCEFWGRDFENSFLKIFDTIFCATRFHQKLISSNREIATKFEIVDWLCYEGHELEKENIVVFPHRLAKEKRPDLFEEVKKRLSHLDAKFIRTKDVVNNKSDYYDLLAKSKVAVSFAEQETFGIAMQEAINCGCVPVAPKKLSYIETIDSKYLYNSIDEACRMIEDGIKNYKKPTKKYGESVKWINQI